MSEKYNKIDNWLEKTAKTEIILVIGSGLSRNATFKGIGTSGQTPAIPLWKDVISAVQNKVQMPGFESLLIFDIFKDAFGSKQYEEFLLGQMPNDEMIPGEIHNIIKCIPKIKAIITTNNIDTLLDKTFPESNRIVVDTDISDIPRRAIPIFYLHGHRAQPASWIFSQSEYEDIERRYPVKISLCRNLLATYPSLFLGFGHSDPDLHSILRFVNSAMQTYSPPMLSISTEEEKMHLEQYWSKIGLSIERINRDKNKDVKYQLFDSLSYLVSKRTELLIKSHMLSPGYRNGSSYMDLLRNSTFDCRKNNDSVSLCHYHMTRAETVIKYIPNNIGLVSYSPYTSQIHRDSEIYYTITEMRDGFSPTGGWGLMPSHREWLHKALNLYGKTEKAKILVTGIGGLPHFVDLINLLSKNQEIQHFEIIIVDICIGPISDIQLFISTGSYKHHDEDTQLYMTAINEINSGRFSIELINDNILSFDYDKNTFDIVLSHHLISIWGYNSNTVRVFLKTISETLAKDGLMVAAFNILPQENSILYFQEECKQNRLMVIDTDSVFDVYDFDSNCLFEYDDIIVDNETLLTIHRKI